ncbi:MAG: hypothetical protein K2X94_00835 [Amoebophilaceae bacterium]|nr:hypothetical protein [Amoebophilaceae bacterium]
MIFQIVAVLLVLLFVWLMVAHIKEAWHDFTHMDEYIERVTFERELRKAIKNDYSNYLIENSKTGLTIPTEYLMRKDGTIKH